MMKKAFFLLTVLVPIIGFPAPAVSIEESVASCKAAGNKPAGKAVQSALKKETSKG